MRLNHIIFVAILISSLSIVSCSPRHNPNYLINNHQDSLLFQADSYDVPIKVGDQLAISVSALNAQQALPYNNPGQKPVLVESRGPIDYPLLGKIQAAGLSRGELRDALLLRLTPYITEPVVSVDFANFKISVLGEVNNPGGFTIPDSKVNILEALALAGDLTKFGQTSPITVIRETNGERKFGYIDLQSKGIFSSPFYRLQQNDIIYVQSVSDKPTAKQEKSTRNLSLITSAFGIITSLAVIIITVVQN